MFTLHHPRHGHIQSELALLLTTYRNASSIRLSTWQRMLFKHWTSAIYLPHQPRVLLYWWADYNFLSVLKHDGKTRGETSGESKRVKKERRQLDASSWGRLSSSQGFVGQSFNNNGLCVCNTCAGIQNTSHCTHYSFTPHSLCLPHPCEAPWVRFRAQEHKDRPWWSGISTDNLFFWQPTRPPELQSPTVIMSLYPW